MAETISFIQTPFVAILGHNYSILDFIIVISIIIIGLLLANNFKKFFTSPNRFKNLKDKSARVLISNFGRYFIILITFIIALQTLGINLSHLTIIASALSVGIGFGLQNIINNLVSGIILMFEGSIKIGDMIELDSATVGKVEEIRLRSTIIKTFDNIEIVVPNGDLVSHRVINRTLTDNIRRLTVPFSVAYGTKVETVQQTILNAVHSSELHFYKGEDKKPLIRMSQMNASSVDYILFIYVDQENTEAPLLSDFLILIYNTLYENNISIPFPQMDVHLHRTN